MRLYDQGQNRLYINRDERQRIIEATSQAEPHIRLFCLVLLYTGCRISEALALRRSSVQLGARLITFNTLKRRKSGVMREVPVPRALVDRLEAELGFSQLAPEAALWSINGDVVNRTTAYRWVKSVMRMAGVKGAMASPKGLRHGYGIHAILSGVPLNLLQKWMGHASMKTTAIYADASGAEELEIADRMWRKENPTP